MFFRIILFVLRGLVDAIFEFDNRVPWYSIIIKNIKVRYKEIKEAVK